MKRGDVFNLIPQGDVVGFVPAYVHREKGKDDWLSLGPVYHTLAFALRWAEDQTRYSASVVEVGVVGIFRERLVWKRKKQRKPARKRK